MLKLQTELKMSINMSLIDYLNFAKIELLGLIQNLKQIQRIQFLLKTLAKLLNFQKNYLNQFYAI